MTGPFHYISNSLRDATIELSHFLTEKGIKHVVVGGISLGQYTGAPRATVDIDIYTTSDVEQFFPEHGPLAEIPGIETEYKGVGVEFLYPESMDEARFVFENPTIVNNVPLVNRDALLYLKLKAQRVKDSADLVQLLKNIPVAQRDSFIQKMKRLSKLEFPRDISDMLEDFESLANIADLEKNMPKKASRQFRSFMFKKLS